MVSNYAKKFNIYRDRVIPKTIEHHGSNKFQKYFFYWDKRSSDSGSMITFLHSTLGHNCGMFFTIVYSSNMLPYPAQFCSPNGCL